MTNLISTLDWNMYLSKKEENRMEFVDNLRTSFMTTGFFLLKNHGIPDELLIENKKLFQAFFKELSLTERMKYSFPDTHYEKGYTPIGVETGEFAKRADYKHFFQLGDRHESPDVKELPRLKEVSHRNFIAFNSLYIRLMHATALSLGLRKHYFDRQLGSSTMRNIHYPAQGNPVVDDGEVTQGGNALGMCASKHTDIDDLTLLHATEEGLQLLHDGKFVPVTCDFDTIIVNVGDMMWHLTGGLYKSGTHRVVCEPNVERFSSPFFGHRDDFSSVRPICNRENADPNVFRFRTEGEFFLHRLEQIKMKKS